MSDWDFLSTSLQDSGMTIQHSGFALDNRSLLTRLIAFQAYCRTIPFGTSGASWERVFFSDEHTPQTLAIRFAEPGLDPRTLPPQLAFLLAFMKMMETPRRLLNGLPERHRQLYYRGELGLSERPAQPDTALVIFRPEPEQAELYLPQGMKLTAGQDSAGTPRLYSLQQSLSINHTRWSDLCWLRAADDDEQRPLCRTLLDESQNIAFPAQGIRLFARAPQDETPFLDGRLVVSPLLLLQGEQRFVEVEYADDLPPEADPWLEVSTIEGWVALEPASDGRYVLPDEVIAAPPEGLAGYQFAHPVLRIINRHTGALPEISSLTVTANNMAGVQMRTDSGWVDIGQSSDPFGSEPLLGDGFQLMSEQWCNQNANFTLTIMPEWQGLPDDFSRWYEGYKEGATPLPVANGDFKAAITPAYNNPQQAFFGATSGGTIPVKPIEIFFPSPRINVTDEALFWRYAPRIALAGKDFLHRIYRQMVIGGTIPAHPPYDPRFRGVTVNAQATGETPEQYVLTPFGYQSGELNQGESQLSALYVGFSGIQPGQQLTLFWQLNTPRQIAAEGLHWHYLAEGAEGEGVWLPLQQEIDDQTERFFHSGRWSTTLPRDACTASTLMPCGRYWLRAQGFILEENDLPELPGTPEQPQPQVEQYPWLFALYANAGTAMLSNAADLAADHFAQPLPAGSINGSEAPVSGLAVVSQPFPSWGGCTQESENEFMQRIAMRLAHRERASSWRDISALLLARFPEVHHIRLPGVENLDGLYQPEPDGLYQRREAPWLNSKSVIYAEQTELHIQTLMIVPRAGYSDSEDPLRPMLNPARLVAMQRYITSLASPWLQLRVLNPEYFTVKVEYQVEWRGGVNIEQCRLLLQETLKQHFMPWRDEQNTLELGNSLTAYDVMSVIQQQPYVDYVRDVRLNGQREPINTTLKVIIIEPEDILIKSKVVLNSLSTLEECSDE
jgi:hypothetical protein